MQASDIRVHEQIARSHAVAEEYKRRMEDGEVSLDQSPAGTLVDLAMALASPYLVILIAYLAAVAWQLVAASRFALDNDVGNLTRPSPNRARFRFLSASAAVSLAATWYHMLAYLVWSYNAFVERSHLAGQELTSLPDCTPNSLHCIVACATAHTMRLTQWLRNTVLFEEAWLHVVQRPYNWWWSIEVCLFTVGVWAMFVRTQGERFEIRAKHMLLVMLLGQTCAISVAQNIFALALAVRSTPPMARARRGSANQTRSDAELMPPPFVVASSRKIEEVNKKAWSERINLVLALAGLASVYMVPSTLRSILAMHLAPLLLILPSMLTALPTPSLLRKQPQLSRIYGSIGVLSLAIRSRSHADVFASFNRFLRRSNGNVAPSPNQLLAVLLAHPAQRSISSDTVCITLSVMADLYFQISSGAATTLFEGWALLLLTPLLGPSTTMSISLAIREARLEDTADEVAGPGKSRSSLSSGKNDTKASSPRKSEKKSSSPRKSGPNSTKDAPSARSTSTKRTPSTSSTAARRRTASTTSAAETTDDGEASTTSTKSKSRASTTTATTKKAPTKRTAARPRKSSTSSVASAATPSDAESVGRGSKATRTKRSVTKKRSEIDLDADDAPAKPKRGAAGRSTRAAADASIKDTPAARAKASVTRPRLLDALDAVNTFTVDDAAATSSLDPAETAAPVRPRGGQGKRR